MNLSPTIMIPKHHLLFLMGLPRAGALSQRAHSEGVVAIAKTGGANCSRLRRNQRREHLQTHSHTVLLLIRPLRAFAADALVNGSTRT